MGRIQPKDPNTVERKEPWDREEFHYKDAPAFILHETGIVVTYQTVFRWTREGLPNKEGEGRVYLPAHTKMRRLFIKRADLIEFINRT